MCEENERVMSLEGGSFSVKDIDDDTRQALEAAIHEVSREEALRSLLEELKQIAQERMTGQLPLEEIEVLKNGLIRVVERMIAGTVDSESFPGLRELSKQFVERDIAHLRGCVKRRESPDIQMAMIRALHPEGEGDGVDEDSPELDEERLEFMRESSPGFARMIQRLEEDIFPEGKD